MAVLCAERVAARVLTTRQNSEVSCTSVGHTLPEGRTAPALSANILRPKNIYTSPSR